MSCEYEIAKRVINAGLEGKHTYFNPDPSFDAVIQRLQESKSLAQLPTEVLEIIRSYCYTDNTVYGIPELIWQDSMYYPDNNRIVNNIHVMLDRYHFISMALIHEGIEFIEVEDAVAKKKMLSLKKDT